MQNSTITIEQLAEKLGGNLWNKGDLKRIYLDRGHNTKKMSTKTYVYEKDGEFKVSCYIECPSQDYNWIKSQQQQVIDDVMEDIEEALSDTVYILTDKDGKVVNYKGEQVALNNSENYLTEGKAKDEIDNCAGYHSYIAMSKNEFDAEVARLDEAERPERDRKAAEEKAKREAFAEAQRRSVEDRRAAFVEVNVKVSHPKYGVGSIIDDDGKVIEVDFGEHGVKKLMKDYAPITKVNA
jgi:hypothetical protein